jgi:hypothetical protein
MANSAILNIPLVSANQNQKEATIATGIAMLEAAGEDILEVDLSVGGVALNATQWTTAKVYKFTGHTVARTVTTPATKRFAVLRNEGTAEVTVEVVGAAGDAVIIQTGASVLVYCDGADFLQITANGFGSANTYTASHTLSSADVGHVVVFNSASAVNLYLEDNTDVPVPIGVVTMVVQKGLGQVSVQPTSSFQEILKPADLLVKTRAKDSIIFLMQVSANTWRAWGDLSSIAFRGALASKTSDQTAADYTTATAVTLDVEAYDSDAIHDNSTNPSRLTVPAGVTKVRLTGHVHVSNHTASKYTTVEITKNGSAAYIGQAGATGFSDQTTCEVQAASPVLAVTAGDYFEMTLQVETDASITVTASRTWFAMEIVE